MKKTLISVAITIGLFSMAIACTDEEAVEKVDTVESDPVAVEEETVEEPVEEIIEEPVEETVETVDNDTNEPVFDASTLEYSTKMESISYDIQTIMNDFSQLMYQAGDNPNLMFDDNWIIDVATQIALLDGVITEVRNIEAPSQLDDVHSLILEAMNEYEFVVDNFPSAIDNMDVNLINECNTAITNATGHITEATSLLQEKLNN